MPALDATAPVTETPAAASPDAVAHFAGLLAFEADCWDVHASMAAGGSGFVVLDVRSPELFAAGHVPGAVNLPRRRIGERNLEPWPAETLFVVYCAGPHCNGADKAALRLAQLGRPVKKMIGGVTGWLDEGFELTTARTDPQPTRGAVSCAAVVGAVVANPSLIGWRVVEPGEMTLPLPRPPKRGATQQP